MTHLSRKLKGNGHALTLLSGGQNGATNVEGNLLIPKKFTKTFSSDPAGSLVGVYPTQQALSPMEWLMHIVIHCTIFVKAKGF